jgi:hypothetical protein
MFTKNSAGHSGGGVIITDDEGVPAMLIDCTFTENVAGGGGGGMGNRTSSPRLVRCTFSENSTDEGGGAIENRDGSQPTLIDCTFSDNSATRGGAILNWTNCNPEITNCTFSRNSSGWVGGALCNDNSAPRLTNCLLIANVANNDGGAAYNEFSLDLTFINCTFTQNSAFYGNTLACNAGLQHFASDLRLSNCIVWDGSSSIWNNDNSTISITYSDVQGGWEGEGNIIADPFFANAEDGDYHLKSQAGRYDPVSESWVVDDVTSPCIDAGDPSTPVGDEPEPNGGRINMGVCGGTAEASKSLPH